MTWRRSEASSSTSSEIAIRSAPGKGRARGFDPVAMIHQTAATDDELPLMMKATLRLVDASGVPQDYLTGAAFAEAMQQVYAVVLEPVQQERLARIRRIADWRLRPELCDQLTAAVLGPLMDALRSERARLLHLCYLVQIRTSVPLPRSVWWTPVVGAALANANPPERLVNVQPLLQSIHHGMAHFIMRCVDRRQLPLRETPMADAIARCLGRQVRAQFSVLLDDAQTQGPSLPLPILRP